MIKWFLVSSLCMWSETLLANEALKKAFSEGIKVSVEVIKYEKEQAHKPIPQGYCVTVTGKEKALDMWQEVKLESLALFLRLSPSLLASKHPSGEETKRLLCLEITQEKEKALEVLKQISKKYPKIEEYITKVEILPTGAMHRVIPGVGEYYNPVEEGGHLALSQNPQPQKALNTRIVLLNKREKSKTLFDNGTTKVVGSVLNNISFVEHTVYRRMQQ